MQIEISDATLDQILQGAVKREIDFLCRQLLQTPKMRALLWCWVLTNFKVRAIQGAGIADDDLDKSLVNLLENEGVAVPFGVAGGSGGSGGGDTGGREPESPSGGGGGNGSGEKDNKMKAGDCSKLLAPQGTTVTPVQPVTTVPSGSSEIPDDFD